MHPSDNIRFYRDLRGKYRTADPASVPRVLLFSWGGESRALTDEICARGAELPVRLERARLSQASLELDNVANHDIAACVLIVSRAALDSESFPVIAASCTRDELMTRESFRLFVLFAGALTAEEFRREMSSDPTSDISNPLDILRENVQLTDNLNSQSASDTAIQLLREYLNELEALRVGRSFCIWKERWFGFVRGCLRALRLQMLLAAGAILLVAARFHDFGNRDWFPWLYVGLGEMWWFVLIALVSLARQSTPGLVGAVLPVVVVIFGTLLSGSILQLWIVTPHWPYLLTGIGVGVLADLMGRMLADHDRKERFIEPGDIKPKEKRVPLPGRRRFRHLFGAPLFPPAIRVFISYSETSPWGKSSACRLHRALDAAGTATFFAPHSIERGTSWRHRLRQEMANASVVVILLDATTAKMKWPNAELATASNHQLTTGLPAIVVLCKPGLTSANLAFSTNAYMRCLLEPDRHRDPALLRIVNYRPGMDSELVTLISKRYRRGAMSVIPVLLSAYIELPLLGLKGLLAAIGAVSCFGFWVGLLVVTWHYSLHHVAPISWLAQRNVLGTVFFLLSYWLGFAARLAVGNQFEIRNRISAGLRTMEAIGFIVFVSLSLPKVSVLTAVDGVLCCALGIILASFYISIVLEKNKRHESF